MRPFFTSNNKPLNTYGGGMAAGSAKRRWRMQSTACRLRAVLRNPRSAGSEYGRVQRILIRPPVFRWTSLSVTLAFVVCARPPGRLLWERIHRSIRFLTATAVGTANPGRVVSKPCAIS
jgi:hypothetical protein